MIIRVVEFIAKPGKTEAVRNAIAERIVPLLRDNPRFINMCTFVSPDEPRLVFTMAFWTVAQGPQTCWEKSAEVLPILASLIDVCQRSQVLEGNLWFALSMRERPHANLPAMSYSATAANALASD